MSRQGFSIADTDTGLYHDPKVLALARRLHDPQRTACAMVLWDACRLESWKAGERLVFTDAAPAWWLEDPAEYLPDLQAVGLLDAEGRIPSKAWASWYGPAAKRRATAEYKGAIGGLMASLHIKYPEAVAEYERRQQQAAAEAPSEGSLADPQGTDEAPLTRQADRPAASADRPAGQPADAQAPEAQPAAGDPDGPRPATPGDPQGTDDQTAGGYAARARAILDDPEASQEVKAGARAMLELDEREAARRNGRGPAADGAAFVYRPPAGGQA